MALHEPDETCPRIRLQQGTFSYLRHFIDAVFKDRVIKLILGCEASIHRGDSDLCVMSDLVEGGIYAFGGEQFPRSGDNSAPIAFGIFTQTPALVVYYHLQFVDDFQTLSWVRSAWRQHLISRRTSTLYRRQPL